MSNGHLNKKQVLAILESYYEHGFNQEELSDIFGVTRATISNTVNIKSEKARKYAVEYMRKMHSETLNKMRVEAKKYQDIKLFIKNMLEDEE